MPDRESKVDSNPERSIAEVEGNMEGRVALVTGVSGGIGLATARQFAKAGASVALRVRRTELIDEEVERLTAAGHNVLAVPADVSDARGRSLSGCRDTQEASSSR